MVNRSVGATAEGAASALAQKMLAPSATRN
jgi:hypothetical protein